MKTPYNRLNNNDSQCCDFVKITKTAIFEKLTFETAEGLVYIAKQHSNKSVVCDGDDLLAVCEMFFVITI